MTLIVPDKCDKTARRLAVTMYLLSLQRLEIMYGIHKYILGIPRLELLDTAIQGVTSTDIMILTNKHFFFQSSGPLAQSALIGLKKMYTFSMSGFPGNGKYCWPAMECDSHPLPRGLKFGKTRYIERLIHIDFQIQEIFPKSD